MTIMHHADDATLMSYSAGTLGEALSAVVVGHLAMCPVCRKELAQMNELGGLVLSAMPGSAITTLPPRPSVVADEVPTRDTGGTSACAAKSAAGESYLPSPLSRLVSTDLNAIAWKRLSLGVWHYKLPLSAGAKGDLRLIKIAPGQIMPDHGHGSTELTLVLDGSYTDRIGHFAAGDLADLDEEIEHQPIAHHKTGCICLIASAEKARFKSIFARIVQPFTGL